MIINVHILIWNYDIQCHEGKTFDLQKPHIRLLNGVREHSTLHPSSIHEESHIPAIGSGQAWGADKAVYLVASLQIVVVYLQHGCGSLMPVNS